MSGTLTIGILSIGLIASAPQSSSPPRLIAQQESPSKGIRGRPPAPDLKKLKEIRGGKGKKAKGDSSRFQPIKPTIRPRGQGRTPGLKRPSNRPNSKSTRPIRPSKTGSQNSRRLRSSDRSADRSLPPLGEEPDEVDVKSDNKIEKEKKCKPLPPYVRVRMNFNEAEVLEIVQWISEQTCKNFIIGDGIRGGKITILSNTAVTANEAYRAFLSALNVNNMTVVKVGKFYKIQMKRDAVKDTIPTYIGDNVEIPTLDQMVTRVVNLKFVDANTVNGTIKQLTTKDGDSYPYAPTNTLIISDTGNNMHRLMKILKQLDTPLGQEEIRVIQVNFAIASELAQTLEEIFGEKGSARSGRSKTSGSHRIKPVRPRKGSTPQPAVGDASSEDAISLSKVIADDRTNKIILVATSRSFPKVQDLINKLDVPIPGEGQIQVVYLMHADAEDLASTLTSLAQGTSGRPKSSSSRKGAKTSSITKAAELFQGEVKVTADKATNSLVIVASLNDFKSLIKVIKKLDIPRRQVFVEAVIMEVNIDTTKEVGLALHGGSAAEIGGETVPLFFGSQFKAQGNNFNSLVPNISMLGFMSGIRGPDLPAEESILGGIALPSFGVMLQALQTDSNVNVLSTPHILTSDNEEAEIKVGENIPIPAGYGGGGGLGSLAGLASMASGLGGTSGATGSRYGGYGGMMGGLGGMMGMGMGAINRQEVGLTLKIKPQINEGNVIRMELEEELSEVKDTSNPLGPTTTKRSAKTVVAVQDGQTVVVGGLMRDKIDIGETKIPILGDIPVLGWFFRTRREQKTKTNLLLFLTPYVIEGPEDFRRIFKRKMEERKEFLEHFYGHGPEYKSFIDFRKKRGPLSDMHINLREELIKVENGGPGSGNEIVVTPAGQIEAATEKLVSDESAPAVDSAAIDPKRSTEAKDPGENRLEVE